MKTHPSVSHTTYSTTERTASDPFIVKNGKKYKVEVKIIQHGTLWKVWQGVQAFFLTISSLGLGLAFQTWRNAIANKWQLSHSGEEKIYIYTRFPPDKLSTTKASSLGSQLATDQ